MFCSVCGKEADEGQLYCGYCGQYLKDTPEDEKKCRICGAVILENHKFCTKCGSTFQIPAVLVDPVPEKPRKKRRRGLRLFLFLLLLSLLGFIFYGGFYIGKNGWDEVPFADKLTFLPFVQLSAPAAKNDDDEPFQDDEKSDDGDSLKAIPGSEEADKSDESDKKEDEPPAPTDSPPAETPLPTATPLIKSVALTGDWQYQDEAHFYLVRFSEKNRYLMVAVESEADKAYSRFSTGTYSVPTTLDNAFQLIDEAGDYVFNALAGEETIEIEITDETHIFEPYSAVPTAFGGLWEVIDGEDYYIYFAPDGECVLGAGLDEEHKIQYIDTQIAYRYDEATRYLQIFDPADPTNFEDYQVDVFEDLGVLVAKDQPVTVVMRKVAD